MHILLSLFYVWHSGTLNAFIWTLLHYILTFIFIICVLTKISVMFISRLLAVWSHPQLTFLLSTSVCYISTAFIAKTHCHIKEYYVKVSACIITIANAPTVQFVSSTKCCVTY